ncbi:hypothetical protein IE53DRAFT_399215 [Violaceomyces palustris]|uniref:Uncharacterized protein n=1 Tax=Violaceomyces palustris TaxID=1673888 RepID=A0ACD0P5T9_9BASI|nr:hypothetical protein IE53DRAFT_399215 [Violaceomyces palustris]
MGPRLSTASSSSRTAASASQTKQRNKPKIVIDQGSFPAQRDTKGKAKANSTTRSKGQLLRRHSTTSAASGGSRSAFRNRNSRRHANPNEPPPLFGGLYLSDLIVVAFFYAINLFRTCGIAELADFAFKGGTYVLTSLPLDFYQRWSLSKRKDPSQYASTTSFSTSFRSREKQRRLGARSQAPEASLSRSHQKCRPVFDSSSSEPEADSKEDDVQPSASLDTVSPFHHLVILLVKFACTSFPHLIPRVLFAEETIGPLVRWRTGGGAAGLVREFTNEKAQPDNSQATADGDGDRHEDGDKSGTGAPPAFRAFWIGGDAHVPVEVRRSDPASRGATTLLYLHGGGFSLGSVAFYAEALIRIMGKVVLIEKGNPVSRCIAVEYDLAPSARFPAPLLQCLRCYAHLIEVEKLDPRSITVAGDSAGANLVMSLLLCLDGQAKGDDLFKERDWSKLPMPAKAILISPWADLRPSGSMVFAPLRNHQSAPSRSRSQSKGVDSSSPPSSRGNPSSSIWTEAVAEYEWDYVAAEALLHFAQVYAGVLQVPRRVRGPMGWIAHICGVLAGNSEDSDGLAEEPATEKEDQTQSKSGATSTYNPTALMRDPLKVLSGLATPPRRLVKAAQGVLTEPLLDTKRSPAREGEQQIISKEPPQPSGMEPIFPPHERRTETVASTSELFVRTWALEDKEDAGKRARPAKGERKGQSTFAKAKQEAIQRLESHHLISPATGDWSRIRLEGGMLVTWGERERLADDIDLWVDRVKQQASNHESRHGLRKEASRPSQDGTAQDSHDEGPAQDGDDGQESPKKQRAQHPPTAVALSGRRDAQHPGPASEWLFTAVERGSAGVHAWPFVSMYLAGTENEREKGLELIAGFIAKSSGPVSGSPSEALRFSPRLNPQSIDDDIQGDDPYSSVQYYDRSPGSMPSDLGVNDEDDYVRAGGLRSPSDFFSVQSSGAAYPEHWSARLSNHPPWNDLTPTPSTGPGTPFGEQNYLVRSAGAADEGDARSLGLGLAVASLANRQIADGHRPAALSPTEELSSMPLPNVDPTRSVPPQNDAGMPTSFHSQDSNRIDLDEQSSEEDGAFSGTSSGFSSLTTTPPPERVNLRPVTLMSVPLTPVPLHHHHLQDFNYVQQVRSQTIIQDRQADESQAAHSDKWQTTDVERVEAGRSGSSTRSPQTNSSGSVLSGSGKFQLGQHEVQGQVAEIGNVSESSEGEAVKNPGQVEKDAASPVWSGSAAVPRHHDVSSSSLEQPTDVLPASQPVEVEDDGVPEYNFSHYGFHHHNPRMFGEGLSDIEEEGSVLSGGNGAGQGSAFIASPEGGSLFLDGHRSPVGRSSLLGSESEMERLRHALSEREREWSGRIAKSDEGEDEDEPDADSVGDDNDGEDDDDDGSGIDQYSDEMRQSSDEESLQKGQVRREGKETTSQHFKGREEAVSHTPSPWRSTDDLASTLYALPPSTSSSTASLSRARRANRSIGSSPSLGSINRDEYLVSGAAPSSPGLKTLGSGRASPSPSISSDSSVKKKAKGDAVWW